MKSAMVELWDNAKDLDESPKFLQSISDLWATFVGKASGRPPFTPVNRERELH